MYKLKLANIMGMDIDNAQHGIGILDALTGINDPDTFLEYCRDKKDGIEYSNRVEKLDTLATRYKKLEREATLPYDSAERFSVTVARKVEEARTYLKNELEVGNDRPFSRLITDGQRYFTDQELKALAQLGSSRYLIELSEINELEGELTKLFLNKYTQKAKYESLSDGQKKVMALVGRK